MKDNLSKEEIKNKKLELISNSKLSDEVKTQVEERIDEFSYKTLEEFVALEDGDESIKAFYEKEEKNAGIFSKIWKSPKKLAITSIVSMIVSILLVIYRIVIANDMYISTFVIYIIEFISYGIILGYFGYILFSKKRNSKVMKVLNILVCIASAVAIDIFAAIFLYIILIKNKSSKIMYIITIITIILPLVSLAVLNLYYAINYYDIEYIKVLLYGIIYNLSRCGYFIYFAKYNKVLKGE